MPVLQTAEKKCGETSGTASANLPSRTPDPTFGENMDSIPSISISMKVDAGFINTVFVDVSAIRIFNPDAF
jgi:hypothetical protein